MVVVSDAFRGMIIIWRLSLDQIKIAVSRLLLVAFLLIEGRVYIAIKC